MFTMSPFTIFASNLLAFSSIFPSISFSTFKSPLNLNYVREKEKKVSARNA